jgi:hypothetical protein
MEKRKLKVNVLDIAIIVAIICSITAIVFHDVIHETIGTPEIREMTVSVSFDEGADELEFSENETVSLVLNNDNGVAISATVQAFSDGKLSLGLKGYKKLGRFYTESGELIELGSDCELTCDETVYGCEVENVDIKD